MMTTPPELGAGAADEDAVSEAACARLVEKCRGGDREAFRELVDLTEPRIRRLMARLTLGNGDLDDLVQDVYLRAWRALPGFRSESRFSTWLFKIAVNVARQWKKSRRPTLSLSEGLDLSRHESADPGDRSLLQAYEQALGRLSPPLRTVFVLHEAEGLSYREIAETLDCPIGTVMSRLHRARTTLLDELRERLEELTP